MSVFQKVCVRNKWIISIRNTDQKNLVFEPVSTLVIFLISFTCKSYVWKLKTLLNFFLDNLKGAVNVPSIQNSNIRKIFINQ